VLDRLEAARREGLLSDLDLQFARFVMRLGPHDPPEVALAACLVSHATGDGHVCIDLAASAGRPLLTLGDGTRIVAPPLARWVEALRGSPRVGAPGDYRPLVLDARHRLYLYRYWDYERQLAADLLARARRQPDTVDAVRLRADLDRLFPAPTAGETDWQRVAAAVALQRRCCVISGGPGTGKTTTVIRLLALLLLQAGDRPLRIALAAPTGKAAGRLQEAVRLAKPGLDLPPAVRAAIPEDAATLHRLLGARPDSVYFRHDRHHPLPVDVLVVDEASMVDLALMAKLTQALPLQARLILLGDKDQLASVEAGAVLGDICSGGGLSAAGAQQLAALIGQPVAIPAADDDAAAAAGMLHAPSLAAEMPTAALRRTAGAGRASRRARPRTEQAQLALDLCVPDLPAPAQRPPAPPAAGPTLADAIVLLQQSYRFGPDSGIGQLARAVQRGRARQAVELLARGRHADLGWQPVAAAQELALRLAARAVQGLEPYLRAVLDGAAPDRAFAAFGRFQILCALRRGPAGVEGVNPLVEDALRAQRLIPPRQSWYPGRPVMVTRNDYNLRLFNGDLGLALVDPGDPRLRVYFQSADGSLRRFPPSRLPPHETVFAMTVHKSQGSEFDRVLLVLPQSGSPLLTRSLLYTGITRARSAVEIWGDRDILAEGVARLPRRSSGLRDALWGAGTGDGV
jgi:exodeoxyribonuclease V alpha subunit